MADSKPAVELEALTKEYQTTKAVTDISLRIERGEFFTLVGPSGCGKTTTLRLLGGFESPTAGEIRFGGESVTKRPPEDRDVGIVFQSYALFPHMTVRENVAYGLKFADPPGGRSSRQRVTDLLELVDLPEMGDRDTTELSGGQQQRVALARALAPGPDILLLDEPMSALDAQLREQLRAQIKNIQRRLDITTIYVTHDQEEALAISDRVAVMQGGRIEQIGTPQEIYYQPQTRFVAEFVGDNNLFTGEIRSQDDGRLQVRVGDAEFDIQYTDNSDVGSPNESNLVGSTATFCVRPEAFVHGRGKNTLTATVGHSEFLGDRTRVFLDWQGQELLARTTEPVEGTIQLGFEPADAHVVTVD